MLANVYKIHAVPLRNSPVDAVAWGEDGVVALVKTASATLGVPHHVLVHSSTPD